MVLGPPRGVARLCAPMLRMSRVRRRQSGIPRWGHFVCAFFWKLAIHATRLAERCPERRISKILGWRCVWWDQTLLYVQGGSASRHGRGHQMLGKRQWDELVQQVVSSHKPDRRWP